MDNRKNPHETKLTMTSNAVCLGGIKKCFVTISSPFVSWEIK